MKIVIGKRAFVPMMSGSKEDFSSTLAGVIALFQDIHAAYTVPTGELLQQKRQTCNIRIFVY